MMLFTSFSYSIDVHYCQGDIKSISLFGEAQSCHTPKKKCPHHQKLNLESNKASDCCSNESFEITNLDEDFTAAYLQDFFDLQLDLVYFSNIDFTSKSIYNTPTKSTVKTSVPIPPLDIYVLLERFLL
ncbi:MAG: hypothetical protein HKO66_10380 [Saprospiraceae bacterium]|nr:hypothetical protein [Saprospiraceae bacterium]